MMSSASAKARLSTLGQAKISRPPALYRTMPSRMLVAATAATSAPAAPAPLVAEPRAPVAPRRPPPVVARARRAPDAGGEGLPARHDVEVLAAGHAGRLVVGPL